VKLIESPFWRQGAFANRAISYQRVWPEPAQIARAPHPAPEVPVRPAEPGEWPTQAARIRDAARVWRVDRSTYARGTDIDTKTGAPLGVVDSFVLGLRGEAERVVVQWLRGTAMLCCSCLTPRKPLPTGLVRVHGDCPGGGQPAVASGEPGEWEFGNGWRVRGRSPHAKLPNITAVLAYVKGAS
jgi:hypothetical protein